MVYKGHISCQLSTLRANLVPCRIMAKTEAELMAPLFSEGKYIGYQPNLLVSVL